VFNLYNTTIKKEMACLGDFRGWRCAHNAIDGHDFCDTHLKAWESSIYNDKERISNYNPLRASNDLFTFNARRTVSDVNTQYKWEHRYTKLLVIRRRAKAAHIWAAWKRSCCNPYTPWGHRKILQEFDNMPPLNNS
jgi:hypothetical protein